MLSPALRVALLEAAGDTTVVMPQRQELLSRVPGMWPSPALSLRAAPRHRAHSSTTRCWGELGKIVGLTDLGEKQGFGTFYRGRGAGWGSQ